jgi:ADP-dependent NAD(P)H-hydrate dehydratase / NAD(P)H-hydrate epimerase
MMRKIQLPSIVWDRNKYQAGYVLGISGSKMYKGAPKLVGLAALRTGAGIVRLFSLDEISDVPYSLICQKWNAKLWTKEIKRASSILIGPGLGRSLPFFKKIKEIKLPMVIDADAIQKGIEYPPLTILTPHHGEARRLLGNGDLPTLCQAWVKRSKCILVLKGAPTWIFSPDEKTPTIIQPGDPGMAKAGTGDVLTGMIAALLAQKMEPLEAAILGCTLHAEAGRAAAHAKSSYGMIAEDLIEFLPSAMMQYGH